MRNRNHSFFSSLYQSPLLIIILIIIIYFLSRSVIEIRSRVNYTNLQLSHYRSNLEKIKAEKDLVESRIEFLNTPAGTESELRDKYRAVKSGEMLAVIIRDNTNQVSTNTDMIPINDMQENWWSRFWQRFKNK